MIKIKGKTLPKIPIKGHVLDKVDKTVVADALGVDESSKPTSWIRYGSIRFSKPKTTLVKDDGTFVIEMLVEFDDPLPFQWIELPDATLAKIQNLIDAPTKSNKKLQKAAKRLLKEIKQ